MRNTKEKILNAALDIFNEEGFYNATLRQVAASLGISQGNLNYHYKTKGDILEVLYFDLVAEMSSQISKIGHSTSLMETLYESSRSSMACLYAYRFLMRDFYKIMQEHERISLHYRQLQAVRQSEFSQLFDQLIAQELLRQEEFEHEYQRLYIRMNILGDNWINTQALLNQEVARPIEYYHALLFEVIYPYLTANGKEAFRQIIRSDG